MTINDQSVINGPVYDIAEEYKQRGYRVTIEPTPKELPQFLSRFKPDVVAVGPDESVVIEVKSSNKLRGLNYWQELTEAIQQHPGWRFELVVDNATKRKLSETITSEQIKELVRDGRRLADEGMLRPALLILWSAAEAAMRLAGFEYEVDLPDFRPATIISRLYTDGVLEREDYEFLMSCMRRRNSIAHGFQEESIDPSIIAELSQITLRLLGANAGSQ